MVVHKSKCAFVNYATRAAAELAVEKSYNNLSVKDIVLRVQWGRPRPQGPKHDLQVDDGGGMGPGMDLLDLPAPPPPPGMMPLMYPSQDPTSLGTSTREYRI